MKKKKMFILCLLFCMISFLFLVSCSNEEEDGDKPKGVHYKIQAEKVKDNVVLKVSEDNGESWRSLEVCPLNGQTVFQLNARIIKKNKASVKLITNEDMSQIRMFTIDLRSEEVSEDS